MWIDKLCIEQKALQMRQECNIQTYGVKDIFSLVDQSGIQLIRYPFGKGKILGFSSIFEGKRIIVSNSSEILSREIFTIAHELGHVVFDFNDEFGAVKVDIDIIENSEEISEARAFHFANCLLMPEEQLRKYIKFALKKKASEIEELDVVRMQLEFQVSFSAIAVRLAELGLIDVAKKSILFDRRDALTSRALFKKLDADERLLKASNVIEVPPGYLDAQKLMQAVERVAAEGRLRPRVIIPVDLFGLPADYRAIGELAGRYDLRILEDGAQGFGGRIGEKRACSFGDAGTTSFFPAKPLGCYGDGGAIFTGDEALAALFGSLKVHGKGEGKYDNVRIGFNSRLDTLQAAVLQVKLKAFCAHELEDVNRVAAWYGQALQGVVELPVVPEGYYSSWAQYTIKLKDEKARDGLQAYLKEQGIPSAVYYRKPLHSQGAYAHLGMKDEDYPVATRLGETVLSLPMHPYLTAEDVEWVCGAVKGYLGG